MNYFLCLIFFFQIHGHTRFKLFESHYSSISQYDSLFIGAHSLDSTIEISEIEGYETSVYIEPPYPNPATAIIRIPVWRYTKTVNREDISLKCYNILGWQIADLTRSLTPISDAVSITEWNMSDLPSGIYIIKCESVNRIGNARIVIKTGGM